MRIYVFQHIRGHSKIEVPATEDNASTINYLMVSLEYKLLALTERGETKTLKHAEVLH